jgi:dihydrodipicolinate synthetase family protein
VDEARSLGAHLLVGILRPDRRDASRLYSDTLAWLKKRTGTDDSREALSRSAVCGFTLCPPRGADLTQGEIRGALEPMLHLDVPTALYQLPQVTLNEMAPETARELAAAYPNFYLLKDTSGADRVALSGLRDVFLVRGAEGDYSRHFAASGGGYDGFLLSTANCFPRELAEVLDHLLEGGRDQADMLSRRLTETVSAVFEVVASLPAGNAFTNANKAMDHFFAFGVNAQKAPPPRLHGGAFLPAGTLEAVGVILARHGWLPRRGYLEEA